MLAATFYEPGDLRVDDVEEPSAGPGELKLRMHATSTCGTDAKIWNHGHPRLDPPQIIGHELAGEVVEIGEGAQGFEIGDRVQVIAAVPCGDCWACDDDIMQVCPNQTSMGYQYPGGFAEYMIVPELVVRVNGVNTIPEGLSYAEASVTEPLACALNAQELARVGEGDTVVVMGAGPIGCLHVRLARAKGAVKVFLTDINEERLTLSADRVDPDAAIVGSGQDVIDEVLRLTDGRGASVIITAAPSGKAQEDAIEMAAAQGRVSFFGGLPKDNPYIRCDSNKVHYSELSLIGANGSSPTHNRRALHMIASGEVPVDDLITHKLPLSEVHAAIEAVISGEAIKVVVEP
ncbi:zinc-dependent dehydrogenase [Euzebya tangerina]|uniref:zinc-dependent dehydrogenase n=1 Tax=Euzebya tangerina TaxID=591198 RepID=UPI000E31B8A8|nr:zinc-dependent dehydrogenase [Euzebya tangerina]